MNNRILCIDMDAFFVSVEQAFKPSLKKRPLAVGGSSERGVLCTCSYEARKYGLHSGMSGVVARSLCPELICLPINHIKYKQVSKNLFSVLSKILPNIQVSSIDEAFVDVTDYHIKTKNIILKVKYILQKYFDLTCTIGVGPNRLIAKMATNINKPNGYYIVTPDEISAFMDSFNVKDVWGIGKSSVRKLAEHGIFSVKDLRLAGIDTANAILGTYGTKIYNSIIGMPDIDDEDEPDRSISKAVTFSYDLSSKREMYRNMKELSFQVAEKLKKEKYVANTVTIYIKNYKFETKTYRKKINLEITTQEDIYKYAKDIFEKNNCGYMPLRLIGVGVADLKKI